MHFYPSFPVQGLGEREPSDAGVVGSYGAAAPDEMDLQREPLYLRAGPIDTGYR
jgi:hypothetical protein